MPVLSLLLLSLTVWHVCVCVYVNSVCVCVGVYVFPLRKLGEDQHLLLLSLHYTFTSFHMESGLNWSKHTSFQTVDSLLLFQESIWQHVPSNSHTHKYQAALPGVFVFCHAWPGVPGDVCDVILTRWGNMLGLVRPAGQTMQHRWHTASEHVFIFHKNMTSGSYLVAIGVKNSRLKENWFDLRCSATVQLVMKLYIIEFHEPHQGRSQDFRN